MNDISAAIAAANGSQLDEIVRQITLAWGKGEMDDDAYSALYGQAHRRRADLRGERPAGGTFQNAAQPRRSIFPPRCPQRSPDRARSIERRRRLAASGPMPPALAARFTVAELACLRVVADEVRAHGDCSLTIAEIAARAGVCRTSCQNALRAAARAGLVHVEERRQKGRKNDPNRITLTSKEWRAWLARGPKGIGFKKTDPTDSRGINRPLDASGPAMMALEREPRAGPEPNCKVR